MKQKIHKCKCSFCGSDYFEINTGDMCAQCWKNDYENISKDYIKPNDNFDIIDCTNPA